MVWKRFKQYRMGVVGLCIVLGFMAIALLAPLLASSRPLFCLWRGEPYFPLARYLLYRGFYTKPMDLAFNAALPVLPLYLLAIWRRSFPLAASAALIQGLLFAWGWWGGMHDPASDPVLNRARYEQRGWEMSWQEQLPFMTPYAKLNLLLSHQRQQRRQERISHWVPGYDVRPAPKTEREQWIASESQEVKWVIRPLLRDYHWEDQTGGSQRLNRALPWWELSRLNRKDLAAALIFGSRVSLVVGLASIALALAIGIPLGLLAGFKGGKWDLILCRLFEVWESMPTLFMLLLIVSLLHVKSLFLIVAIIGLFGWTSYARYVRAESLKQRNLSYVLAGRSLGFSPSYLLFSHILPNSITPVLAILPFAIMGAITTEASLSFLGLGEEGSASWGVLMDEGRSAFPAESALLWPPAILLTLLLVSIALVGDALRDTLDPKTH